MSKAKCVMGFCSGILLGTGVASLFSFPVSGSFGVCAGALLMLLLRWHGQLGRSLQESFPTPLSRATLVFALIPYVALGFAAGTWRTRTVLTEPNTYEPWYGTKQDFEGVVVAEADVRQDRQLVTVQPRGFQQRVLVTTTLGGRFTYGDLVWVRGKVLEPKVFDDFDYPGYLARFSTYALMRYPKMIVLSGGHGNSVMSGLLSVKAAAVRRLRALYPEVEGNLLLGVLIGAKRGLPDQVLENFARTGTTHILAVSGFNISICITALGFAAYVVGRRWQLLLALVAVLCFVIIAGPSSSVVRAAGMGLLLILATTAGRLYNARPALLLVAAGMVFSNPRVLFWDIGFQLSAAATAGILLCAPLIEQRYGQDRPLAGVVTNLGVTFSAIVATLPISLFHFGKFSTVAPLANLVVVPFVPLMMALGALSLLPFVGAGFAWVGAWFLRGALTVIALFARPSWASVSLSMSGQGVLFCYAILTLAYVLALHLARRKKVL